MQGIHKERDGKTKKKEGGLGRKERGGSGGQGAVKRVLGVKVAEKWDKGKKNKKEGREAAR